MKPQDTIDFHIRWAWYKILRIYNNMASEHGVNMSVGYALLNIDRNEGTPSTKLGPIMGMESRSLTRTLRTMEDAGLIVRRPDAMDKRVMRIHLTPLGEEKRKLARDAVIRFNEMIFGQLDQKDIDNFFVSIRKINELLEKRIFNKKNV